MSRSDSFSATLDALRGTLRAILILGFGTLIGLCLFTWLGGNRPKEDRGFEEWGGGHSVFTPVIEEILPGVVSIDVERRFRHRDLLSEEDGTWFEQNPDLPDEIFEIPSSGSGFLIDGAGHILTNDHVVRDVNRIDVHLSDGTTQQASLIGRDPMTDIAVLRITPDRNLPTVPLGNSDEVRIGDWVVAIGNPLGMLEGSVTLGIVSGKGRSEILIRGGSPSYQDFIQTDASINPGNSGGPLINRKGEAIGVNTAFNGVGSGIGFAISMNMAREVAEQLITMGRVPRGFLGVNLMTMDRDLARGWGLGDRRGVVITDVQGGTPASAAGLLDGDIVVEFDGVKIEQIQPFRLLVAGTEVGRPVPVRFLRRGKEREVNVALVERSDPVPVLPEPAEAAGEADLGLFLSPLRGEDRGVQVDSVRAEGPAYRSGLRTGDRILEVGWSEVVSPQDVRREIDRQMAGRGVVVLHVWRAGFKTYLTVRANGS